MVDTGYPLRATVECEICFLGTKYIREGRSECHRMNPISDWVFSVELEGSVEVADDQDKAGFGLGAQYPFGDYCLNIGTWGKRGCAGACGGFEVRLEAGVQGVGPFRGRGWRDVCPDDYELIWGGVRGRGGEFKCEFDCRRHIRSVCLGTDQCMSPSGMDQYHCSSHYRREALSGLDGGGGLAGI